MPRADSNQQILRFSRLTREAMYRSIHEELKAHSSDARVTDYLVFFCLGNRDAGPQVPPEGSDAASKGADAAKNEPGILSAINRRHMIYVHSKFMVVDDEVAIIGATPFCFSKYCYSCICSSNSFCNTQLDALEVEQVAHI